MRHIHSGGEGAHSITIKSTHHGHPSGTRYHSFGVVTYWGTPLYIRTIPGPTHGCWSGWGKQDHRGSLVKLWTHVPRTPHRYVWGMCRTRCKLGSPNPTEIITGTEPQSQDETCEHTAQITQLSRSQVAAFPGLCGNVYVTHILILELLCAVVSKLPNLELFITALLKDLFMRYILYQTCKLSGISFAHKIFLAYIQ